MRASRATAGILVLLIGVAILIGVLLRPRPKPSPAAPPTGMVFRREVRLVSLAPGLRLKPGEPIDVVGEFATDDPDITARMVIVAPINAAKATLGDVIVQDKNPGTALFRFETRVKAHREKRATSSGPSPSSTPVTGVRGPLGYGTRRRRRSRRASRCTDRSPPVKMPRPTPHRPRRGVTLIETMVAVAIISLLFALLLVGVQAARQSSRRLQCANHLRQIGQGLAAYSTVFGSMPYGNGLAVYSIHVAVLPYIDQQPLYNSIGKRGMAYDAHRSNATAYATN